jgi:hypothetical protein
VLGISARVLAVPSEAVHDFTQSLLANPSIVPPLDNEISLPVRQSSYHSTLNNSDVESVIKHPTRKHPFKCYSSICFKVSEGVSSFEVFWPKFIM